MQIFHYWNFFFSTLEGFSEKTYEKTCRFYNIFSKYYSNCARLPNFALWIFFSKICWPFQFNVHIFRFPPLLQENLWKDLPMLWLNFKHCIIMCTLTKFCHLKIFVKKTAAVSKCQQFIIHLLNFEQHLQLNLWKDLPFFYIFWNFDFVFTSLQNFMISKIEKKKKKKKNAACSLNNIFDRNGQKSFDFCDVFFKFVSLFTLSRRFIMTAFLQELQLFQWC